MFAKVKPNTQIIGQNIIYFNQVASTNLFAQELMKQQSAGNGTVIIAEFQTRGKGQIDRTWMSEPFENLMFSIILSDVTNQALNPFIINKAIALSLRSSINKLLPGHEVSIKWPNDILVDKMKICGILVENNFSGQHLNYSIVGVGLNVNQADFAELNGIAVSFKMLLGYDFDREELLKSILENIETNYFEVMNGNSDGIEADFDQKLLGFHQIYPFEINKQLENARIMGCDKDGRLRLEIKKQEKAFRHGSIKQLINA